MAATLPFDGFLALLRAKGYAVGLHEHLALAKLLSRWPSTSSPEFGDALAALIARSDEEIAAIRRLFDEVFAERPAMATVVAPTPTPVGARGLARRYVWAIAAALAVLAIGLGVWRYVHRPDPIVVTQPQLPSEPPPVPPSLTEPVTVPPPPAPAPPPVPERIEWSLVMPLAVGLLLLAIAGLWALKARDARRRWLDQVWASTVERLPGPFHFPFILKDPVARLPRIDVEDAATILGRAITNDAQTRVLDVRRTVRQTVRNGLLPTFVVRPRRVVQTILVVQDVSEDMRVWRSKVDLFLTDLRRQGIPLERYYFDGDIRRLSDAPHHATVELGRALRRRPSAPVLIISNGSGLAATLAADAAAPFTGSRGRPSQGGRSVWLDTLRQRERRSWLTPVSDVALWPAELEELPLRVWPMTRRGLSQAARDLVGIDAPPPVHVRTRILDAGRVSLDGIERMKRLASLVPYPSMALLELLRRQFAPDVADAVLLRLLQEAGRPGSPVLRLNDEELRRLLAAMRFETPKLEARVRRMLIGVLQESEPVAGSAAHARWEVAVALHRAALADLGEGSKTAATATLEHLGRGPLWEEVRQLAGLMPGVPSLERHAAVAGEGGAGVTGKTRRAAGGPGDGPPSSRPPENAGPMPWVWPGVRELAPAALAAALVVALGWQLRMFPLRALAHVPNAYGLAYDAGAGGTTPTLQLSLPGSRGAIESDRSPTRVDLYRGSTLFRAGIELAGASQAAQAVRLESADLGGHFQIRAPLPAGNLALSPSVWVPGDQIVVLIDALPWARVTIEGDQAPPGAQTTPFLAALKPGTTYQLRLENGGVTPPLEQTISVPARGSDGPSGTTFRITMPGFDPSQTASQLSGSPADPVPPARR